MKTCLECGHPRPESWASCEYCKIIARAERAEAALREIKAITKDWLKGQNSIVRGQLLAIDGIAEKGLGEGGKL